MKKDRRTIDQGDLHAMEKAFWDERAPLSPKDRARRPLYHIPLYNGIIEDFLSPLDGMEILELGCNTGHLSYFFSDRGGNYTGIDISENCIEIARKLKEGVKTTGKLNYYAGTAEKIQFDDNSFDICFGRDILHHTVVEKAIGECKRVLKPGGKAVFVETTLTNPLVKLGREKIAGKFGSRAFKNDTEFPLTSKEIILLKKEFKEVRIIGVDFFRLLLRMSYFNQKPAFKRLFEKVDDFIFLSNSKLGFLSYEKIFLIRN